MATEQLQSVINALGFTEKGKYKKEPDCLETLKELVRYLKHDDDHLTIRRELGKAQLIRTDLIPLIKGYHDDEKIFEVVIRLMVNLTQPAKSCFDGQVPEDKAYYSYYYDIQSHLEEDRKAFVDEKFFSILANKLGAILEKPWDDRLEDDTLMIERLLVLVRNVFHIPPNPKREKRTDDDATVHDQILWALHKSGLEELLLYIAATRAENNYAVHVLEIISLLMREQTAESLASVGSVSDLERQKEKDELRLLREKEKAMKMDALKKYSSRHSRFLGTYVIKNVQSISDQPLVYHRPLNQLSNIDFDAGKKKHKIPKNRKPITEEQYTRRSTLSIRTLLKDFCAKFLDVAYNQLMKSVKDILNRASAGENDETFYLWAIRFFLEFSRVYNFRIDVISEIFQLSTFHYIQTQVYHYEEMIMMEKGQALNWATRLHLALSAYREMLLTLNAMSGSSDSEVRESAKVMKSNIFYQPEYRDMVLTLFKAFRENFNSRAYLRELIETTHLFLKMLEGFTKSQAHMVVKKVKRKAKKKKPKRTMKAQPTAISEPIEKTDAEVEAEWMEICDDLSALIRLGDDAELPSAESLVFDPTSDKDTEGQKIDAMVVIQEFLQNQDCRKALACFRAARNMWPENDTFGHADILPEEEFLSMREIYMAKLPRKEPSPPQEADPAVESESEEEEEEEVLAEVQSREHEFSFLEFVRNFAHEKVLRPVIILMKDFAKNSPQVNHYTVKLLHRIVMECGLPALLFQASLFRAFQDLLCSPYAKLKQFDEIVIFAKFLIRKFVKASRSNPKIFIELLCFKTRREASEVIDGYGSYQAMNKNDWTADQEIELKRLFDLYNLDKDDTDPPDKVIDYLEENLTSRFSRRKIINQLLRQGLIENHDQVKRPPKVVWTEEDDTILREEFDQFDKDSVNEGPDVVDKIIERLKHKNLSRRRVINRMVAIKLIENPAEFRKKKPAKPFEEGDIEQLRALFDEHRNDDTDPLACIKRGLTVKHTKAEIRDKLFELGLIVSRNELDKKNVESDEDSASSSEEEFEVEVDVDVGFEDSELIDEVKKDAFTEARGWISDLLDDNAADRRISDDPEDAVPIVPILEFQETALEEGAFVALLTRIGIRKPGEQENFWRIPESFSSTDLQTRAQIIKNLDLEGLKGLPIPKQKVKETRKKTKKPKPTKRKPLKLVRRRDDSDEDVQSVSSNEPEWQTKFSEDFENIEDAIGDPRAAEVSSSDSVSSFSSGSDIDGVDDESGNRADKVKKKKRSPKPMSESDSDVSVEKSPQKKRKKTIRKRRPKQMEKPDDDVPKSRLTLDHSDSDDAKKIDDDVDQSDEDVPKSTAVGNENDASNTPAPVEKVKKKRITLDSSSSEDDDESEHISTTRDTEVNLEVEDQDDVSDTSQPVEQVKKQRKRVALDSSSSDDELVSETFEDDNRGRKRLFDSDSENGLDVAKKRKKVMMEDSDEEDD